MILFLFIIMLFNSTLAFTKDEIIDEIVIEDSYIEENFNIKTIKNNKDQSVTKLLEDKTTLFIRKNGGIGKKISIYLDGSTSSQISLYIEGFEYSAPTLAYFSPTALYFGNFNKISIDKGLDNSSGLTTHTAKIDFTLSKKDYLSSFIGSYRSFGLTLNKKIEINKDLSLYLGVSSLKADNNFNYIDLHNQNKIRKNNHFYGSDIHLKIEGKSFKILNYFSINSYGNPGSNQFEKLKAKSKNIENLLGIKYFFELKDLLFEFKISNNYKNYSYQDLAPMIIGLKEIKYQLDMNIINSNIKIDKPITDYTILSLKLNNLLYFAKSGNQDKRAGTPFVKEYHPSIALLWEHIYFDEKLLLNFNYKNYLFEQTEKEKSIGNKHFINQYGVDISYKVDENLKLSIGYKKGIRIPYLEEKYYYSDSVKGNPNLKEEISKNFNLNLELKNRYFGLNFELYYKKLKDNIIFMPISFGLYRATNTLPATSKGGNINFYLDFNYFSLLNIFSFNETVYDLTQKHLPQTPQYQNRLSIIFKYKQLFFTTIYKYRSLYYNNIFETDIIAQKNIVDLDLSYKTPKYKISFKVNNLTDNKRLEDSRHIPLMDRSYFLYFFFNL